MASLSVILGNPHTAFYEGTNYVLEQLDLGDVAELEDMLGDIQDLNLQRIGHLRLIVWFMLRKADPALTDSERSAGRYRMTLKDSDRLFPAQKMLKDASAKEFIQALVKASGLISEEPSGNDEAPEEAVVTGSGAMN